jgi:hypothetical protein
MSTTNHVEIRTRKVVIDPLWDAEAAVERPARAAALVDP